MSLDPIILKGIYLLRSKSKESAQQLKDLIDELIVNSKVYEEKISIKEYDPIDNIEKLKRDIIDLGTSNNLQPKKFKAGSSTENFEKEEDPKIIPSEQKANKFSRGVFDTFSKEDYFDDLNVEASDIANDISEKERFTFDIGISCVVCKKTNGTLNNQIIECLDCHSLYHQECHTPTVSEDVNDPRFVWYCQSCTIKEEDVSLTIKSPPYQSKDSKSSTVTPKSAVVKPKRPDNLTSHPFKRIEQKSPISTPSPSSTISLKSASISDPLNIGVSFGSSITNQRSASPAFAEKNGFGSFIKSSSNGSNASKSSHKFPNTSASKGELMGTHVGPNNGKSGSSLAGLNASTFKGNGNKIVPNKAGHNTQQPILTGLAGLAANLLRQSSPNNSPPTQSANNHHPTVPKTNATKNVPHLPSHIGSTSSHNALSGQLHHVKSSSSTPNRIPNMTKKLGNQIPLSSNTNRPLASLSKLVKGTNYPEKPHKTSLSSPSTSKERSSSLTITNSPLFNPPTMKDFEKRLQKLKKKKGP